jgi:RHS repeat-associated protein
VYIASSPSLTPLFSGMAANTLTLGYKAYELSNHLGNVLTTISDNYAPQPPTGGVSARVLSSQDYFPFGMVMTERSFQEKQERKYRFGFNGMESDEDFGEGSYTTQERMVDVRIGRWMSLDPVFHEGMSMYCAFDNNPIFFSDPSGADSESTNKDKKPKKKEEEATKTPKEVINVIILAKKEVETDETMKLANQGSMLTTSSLKKIYATDASDALKQLKELATNYEIGNLFICSHGVYSDASFKIGDASTITNGNFKQYIKYFKEVGNCMAKDGNIILMSCHTGNPDNNGALLVKRISYSSHMNVYGNHSWGMCSAYMFSGFASQAMYANEGKYTYAERKRAYDGAGTWTMAKTTLENGTYISTIQNVNALHYNPNGTFTIPKTQWTDIDYELIKNSKPNEKINKTSLMKNRVVNWWNSW